MKKSESKKSDERQRVIAVDGRADDEWVLFLPDRFRREYELLVMMAMPGAGIGAVGVEEGAEASEGGQAVLEKRSLSAERRRVDDAAAGAGRPGAGVRDRDTSRVSGGVVTMGDSGAQRRKARIDRRLRKLAGAMQYERENLGRRYTDASRGRANVMDNELANCTSCGKFLSTDWAVCPFCGERK